MENAEEVLQILERFTKLKQKNIPKELDEYIAFVAKTGDTVYRWPILKYLFREKLANVISEFYEINPSIDGLPQYPNVDPFNYEAMKKMILDRFEAFNAAPFTVQRICELLTEPRRQYTRVDKFMRAVEKNILVVSTQEPGRKRNDSETNESFDTIIYGGDLSSEVNVDIEMDGDFCLPAAELVVADEIASTSHVTNTTTAVPIGNEVNTKQPQALIIVSDKHTKKNEVGGSEKMKGENDDDFEKDLSLIQTAIDKRFDDAVDTMAEQKDEPLVQHTESELLQSIIETAKAADIDVTEGSEISHVKKLQNEIEKIDAPPTTSERSVEKALEVSVSMSPITSPKRERELDVDGNENDGELDQQSKKAKFDTEEASKTSLAASEDDHTPKDENTSIPVASSVQQEEEEEVRPDEVVATDLTPTIVEDVTDSSSSSSSSSGTTSQANAIESDGYSAKSDASKKKLSNEVSPSSEFIPAAASVTDAVEPTVEPIVDIAGGSTEPAVELSLPVVSEVEEPIIEIAPVILEAESIPEISTENLTSEIERTIDQSQVVTIEVHREPEAEKLEAELIDLPTTEDSVEMDIIPPTLEPVMPNPEATATSVISATVLDIDPVNVMATDDESAILAASAEIEMPPTGTAKTDEHAMDVDESSSGAISSEPMEDQ